MSAGHLAGHAVLHTLLWQRDTAGQRRTAQDTLQDTLSCTPCYGKGRAQDTPPRLAYIIILEVGKGVVKTRGHPSIVCQLISQMVNIQTSSTNQVQSDSDWIEWYLTFAPTGFASRLKSVNLEKISNSGTLLAFFCFHFLQNFNLP